MSPECVVLSVNCSDTEDYSSNQQNTGDDEVAENAITPQEQENITTNTSHVNFADMATLTSGIRSSSGDTSSATGNAPTTSIPLTRKKHKRISNTHPTDSNTSQLCEQLKDIVASEHDFAYGVGVMIVAKMRKMSEDQQDTFALQALQILRDLAKKDGM